MANDRNAGRKRILTVELEHKLYNDYLNGLKVAELSISYNISIATVNRIISRNKSN